MTKRASRLLAQSSFKVRWSGDVSGDGSSWEIEAPGGSWGPLVSRHGAPGKRASEGELAKHARDWARSRGIVVGHGVDVVVTRWPPRVTVVREAAAARSAAPRRDAGRVWRLVMSSRRSVVGTFVTTGITVPIELESPDAPERAREHWEAEVARRAAKNGRSN